jgi:DNA-binding IclR family transcriptional regulator
VKSEEPVRYSLLQQGACLPLHCGASAKILVAYLSEKKWDKIIAKEGLGRYTKNAILHARQLKTIRRRFERRDMPSAIMRSIGT